MAELNEQNQEAEEEVPLEYNKCLPINNNSSNSNNDNNNGRRSSSCVEVEVVTQDRAFLGQTDSAVSPEIKDENDPRLEFAKCELFFRILTACLFLLNVALDVHTACTHHQNGNHFWFQLTLIFVLVPGFITSLLSLKYYLKEEIPKNCSPNSPKFLKKWLTRGFLLLISLSPLIRDIEGIMNGLKMRDAKSVEEKKTYYKRMIAQDKNKSKLNLLLGILEDGPQLVLQFYIFVHPREILTNYQACLLILSMIFSLLGISLSLAFFHKTHRISLENKEDHISTRVAFFIGIFTAFILLSRVTALGLFGFISPFILMGVIAQRWIVMTVYISSLNETFCQNHFEQFLYNFLLGLIFIFIYVNPKNSPTRWRLTFFYLYTLIENSLLMGFWYSLTADHVWFKSLALTIHFSGFFLGIVLMAVYYRYFHPKSKIFPRSRSFEEGFAAAKALFTRGSTPRESKDEKS